MTTENVSTLTLSSTYHIAPMITYLASMRSMKSKMIAKPKNVSTNSIGSLYHG
ncbi:MULTISPECIES: hypothetical protein [unclassified Nitratiruptor]|uniref:hypothetical protein n=1 Tax=unclassified Nitratiruptor TaxID=2624044 RepID=UPI0019159643|nr:MULTISPECIES: hypothetical protein [unclassified Nitratiruptor]